MEFNQNLALGGVATMLHLKGKHDEAFAISRKVHADDAERTKALEDGFKKAGYKGAYRTLADFMAKRYGKPEERGDAGVISNWYRRAGDYEEAIDWLEKAYEEHGPDMPYIGLNTPDTMRSNPRFQELLRKMNLPVDEKE